MRGERQKTACSSAFTSWLTLKNKVFALRENAVLSHEFCFLSCLFCICGFSFSLVFYMHFEISWVALLTNLVVFTFSFTEFVAITLLSSMNFK